MLTAWRKARARRAAKAARAAAHKASPDAARRLVDNFPDEIWPALHSVVAGYHPIRDEIDPTPLLETFHCEQARLALPVVESANAPLTFRSWSPGQALEVGPFGVEAPDAAAVRVRPVTVLLPLLAFDDVGVRLGYGGGFYDRTLSALRSSGAITAIGLAYEGQRVRRLPASREDQKLDWVVTEARAIRFDPM